MTQLHRRQLLAAALCLAAVPVRPARPDEGCPGVIGETVRWIVPFTAGGGFDVNSRLLEPYLEPRLGAEIAVENVTGAGGLTGSKTIRDAAPDGRTVGIVNGGGLLMARLLEGDKVPDLVRDFTILGRLGRQAHVWVAAPGSRLATIADLDRLGGQPVVFGIQDVGSGSFVASALGSHVLGLAISFVAGYRGSQETALALMRGEVELASAPFESLLDQIEAGDLRPLLQISERSIADHPALAGVPTLTDVAAEWAARRGQPAERARQGAKAVADITDTGRFVVAPAGLASGLAACLDAALAAAAADPGFTAAAAAARRSLDVLGGREATRYAQEVAAKAAAFAPVVAEAVRRVRA